MKHELAMLNDRVLIKPGESESMTKGGLYIPDTGKDQPQTAKVIAVGPGQWRDGELISTTVEIGDDVLFPKYSGSEVELDGEKYLVIHESDLLAIVREEVVQSEEWQQKSESHA